MLTLRRVHAAGIVHRDVRPSNLLRRHGGILLCDWNAAVEIGHTAQFAGTLHYSGDIPLQALEHKQTYTPSPRDDLESLVRLVVAYRLLTNCDKLLQCSDAASTRHFWADVAALSTFSSISFCFQLAKSSNYDGLLEEFKKMYSV